MGEPLVLSLETATLAGSLAVSRGEKILAKRVGTPDLSHSNTLLSDIDEILSSQDLTVQDIDLFAVASGPGSFTGLRIGIATVKALADTLNRRCLGVPTLEAIAHSAGTWDAVVAVLPAGRGEVFVQIFSTSQDVVTPLDQPQHLSPEIAIERYIGRPVIRWAGEGSRVYSSVIEEQARKAGYNFTIEKGETTESGAIGWVVTTPSANLAEHVAVLALAQARKGVAQVASTLRAIYVRPSDAELKP